MKKFSLMPLIVLSFFIFTITACSSSEVKIASLSDVHKVGIVSISANRGIRKNSIVPSVTELTSKVASVGEDQLDSEDKDEKITALLNHATSSFISELSDKLDWRVTPVSDYVKSTAYQAFTEKVKKANEDHLLNSVTQFGYATLKDTERVPIEDDELDEAYKNALQELAQELDLDAVLVINLDIAYASGTSIMGYGTAVADVGIGCALVSRSGSELITTGDPNDDETFRQESSDSVPMAMGEIVFFDPDVQKMIKDSISKGAKVFANKLKEKD